MRVGYAYPSGIVLDTDVLRRKEQLGEPVDTAE
jgi:hypothetical protein